MKILKTLKKITLLKKKKIKIMRCVLSQNHLSLGVYLKLNRRGVSLILIFIDRILSSSKFPLQMALNLLMKKLQMMKKTIIINSNNRFQFNFHLLLNPLILNLYSRSNSSLL
jgi:hypothetical protein